MQEVEETMIVEGMRIRNPNSQYNNHLKEEESIGNDCHDNEENCLWGIYTWYQYVGKEKKIKTILYSKNCQWVFNKYVFVLILAIERKTFISFFF